MKIKELAKYISFFVLAVAVIIVYKTFDNFGIIIDLFKKILALLTPFFIGFGISYILYIPCQKIEKLLQKTKVQFVIKWRRGIAVASIYAIFIATITLILVAIIPAIVRSCYEFLEQLPSFIAIAIDWINSLDLFQIDIQNMTIQKLLTSNFFSLQEMLNGINFSSVNKYAQGVMNFGTGVFNIFMGIVISIYILIDRKNIKEITLRFVRLYIKEKPRQIIGKYLRQIDEFIRKYIYCMIIDAGIIFVISFIALSIMKVKYAPLFALILGSFNMIPYFGAIIATVITSVTTIFTGSLTLGIMVAVVMLIIQQLDGNFIQPKLLSGSLEIKPFWVIFGIMLGGGLFGVLGIFLAVPIIALLRIMMLDLMDGKARRLEIANAENAPKPTDIEKKEVKDDIKK
ncbi:MAG: AI-2E family transporter [Oscillospiraceae bacterium]